MLIYIVNLLTRKCELVWELLGVNEIVNGRYALHGHPKKDF